jgi:microcin C transport system substrate-binding protein
MLKHIFCSLAVAIVLCSNVLAAPQHGIAMHGKLKYGPDQSFDYVNVDAPVGGEIRLGSIGTFDTYNPFVTKGTSPGGINLLGGKAVFESLMMRPHDEPFSLYGLLAESVEVAPDRSWIKFTLRPEAKWADGKPITAEDVVFSQTILKEKGRPNLRLFYSKVKTVEVLGSRQVKFTFDKLPDEDRYDPELPLLIGLMTILPKHLWKDKDFEKLGLKDMVGSGPYRIVDSKMGHSITYERRPDYWGWNLPIIKGHYNFQKLRFDYYRNAAVAKEAFKAGEYDFCEEPDPNHWQNEYKFKAVQDGRVTKVELAHKLPVGFKGFVFNTRRDFFANRDVRQALSYAFDFDWANKTMFNGGYTRTRSFFDNTELASQGKASDVERSLFGPYGDKVAPEILNLEYQPPSTKDGKALRENLAKAVKLLDLAGWIIKDGVRVNKETGKPLQFEILLFQPTDEKIALAYSRNLKRLGVKVNIRVVDAAQYERRRMDFDYDMIINTWGNSLSPGREQCFYWGSKFAEEPGSRNYPGVKDPVVDHLCNVVATAQDRDTLISAARALDRTLLWGYYVVPLFHNEKIHLAYWNKLGHPDLRPDVGVALMTWWSKDAEKEHKP